MITLHGFGRVHPLVHGLTRDLRVEWALEELGLPYRVNGLDHTGGETSRDEFRRISPFKQLPVIEDDGFVLAESGAILLHSPRRPADSLIRRRAPRSPAGASPRSQPSSPLSR